MATVREQLEEKYGAPKQTMAPQVVPSAPNSVRAQLEAKYKKPTEAPTNNILQGAFVSLIGRPAIRVAELGARGIGALSGSKELQQNIEAKTKQPVKLPLGLGTVEPVKSLEQSGAKQISGQALETASYLAPYGKIAGGATKALGAILPKATPALIPKLAGGSVAGATGAYGFETGQKLQEGKTIPEAITPGTTTALGAILPPVLEGGAKAVVGGAQKLIGGAQQKIISDAQKKVQDFIVSKKSIENKVIDLEKQKVPIREMLSDEHIFRGLKVEKNTINPDEAIGVIRNRIDEGLNITQDFLPEVDKYAPKISKEAYRARAHAQISPKGIMTKSERDTIAAIDAEIDVLPAEFLPSQLDNLRAKYRVDARSAKGQLKRDSEYAALENSARDLVFESVDGLPAVENGEFAKLRTYIKHNIDLEKFLDTTLRGQKVAGGRLGQLGGRIIGAVAGSQGGVFGAIVGAEAGAKISSILTNSALGSSAKLRLIKNATDNPEVLQKAREMLAKQMQYEAPRLTAPKAGSFRSVSIGGAPIIPPAPTTYEAGAQKIATEPIKQPLGRLQLNAPGQNPIQLRSPQSQSLTTTPTATVSKNIIPPTVPQTTVKSKGLGTLTAKSDPLLSEARKYKTAEEFVGGSTELTYKNLQENPYSIKAYGKDFNEPVEYHRAGAIKKSGDIWLTDNPAGAAQYASAGGTKTNSYIVQSKNPLIIDASGGKYAKGNIDINKILTKEEISNGYTNNPTTKQKFIDYAKNNGFDSVQFSDSFPDGEGGMKSLVVWNPSQIKTRAQLTSIWEKAHKK